MARTQQQLVQEELRVIRRIEADIAGWKAKRASLDYLIKQGEEHLARLNFGLKHYLEKRELSVTPTGKLTRSAATAAKEKMGAAIYEFLNARRGQKFRRTDITPHLPSDCRYPWHKVMAYWEKVHRDQLPISHDGAATSARQYWVK